MMSQIDAAGRYSIANVVNTTDHNIMNSTTLG